MAGRFFALRSVADFAPGFFENTAMECGCIQLLLQDGVHHKKGSYTSPPLSAEAFFSLRPSWNADTPWGTSVEVQVRVRADGRWSRWFSFGQWSPYIHSQFPEPQRDGIASLEGGALTLAEGSPAADTVQLRVFLYTADTALSPKVWMLAAGTNAASKVAGLEHALYRVLEMPAYGCLNRDPALGAKIASATALTMLMNRNGCDLLPEEVARMCYDSQGECYGNLAYLTAAAGAHGFTAFTAYSGISDLRREIWEGRAVCAYVRRRDTLAAVGAGGYLVVVRGFAQSGAAAGGDGAVAVLDPMAKTGAEAVKELSPGEFAAIYTGLAIFLRPGPAGAGLARPQRKAARLLVQNRRLRLETCGETLLPGPLHGGTLPDGMLPATLCYTLSEDTAYPQQAQKQFYYPQQDEKGEVYFDEALAKGRRLTFYLTGSCGHWYVAEKNIEKITENPE